MGESNNWIKLHDNFYNSCKYFHVSFCQCSTDEAENMASSVFLVELLQESTQLTCQEFFNFPVGCKLALLTRRQKPCWILKRISWFRIVGFPVSGVVIKDAEDGLCISLNIPYGIIVFQFDGHKNYHACRIVRILSNGCFEIVLKSGQFGVVNRIKWQICNHNRLVGIIWYNHRILPLVMIRLI